MIYVIFYVQMDVIIFDTFNYLLFEERDFIMLIIDDIKFMVVSNG